MSSTRAKLGLIAAAGFTLCALPVLLLGGTSQPAACAPTVAAASSDSGGWVATAYGPPWGGIQGDGVTATGLNLSAGQPAYEIAVDPTVIPLGSFEHVTPNPFGTDRAFYAGDTGAAILDRHVDIYDWQGRSEQDAWGERHVQVTPASDPGTGNLLSEITAPTSPAATTTTNAGDCQSLTEPLALTGGPSGQILPDGQAEAPADAPAAVKLAIAAGNQIIDKPYEWGGGHGTPLSEITAGYDCSGSTSYLLYGGGLFGLYANTAEQFETWGQSGPGAWITVYANSAHVFIEIAGIVLDTAHYSATSPAGTGPRWQPASTIAAQYAGDEAAGNGGFVQRHPEGY